jgi:regulation of enolase protein 1 (concanavalin A-like superfamily)
MGRFLIVGLFLSPVLVAAPVPRDEAGRIPRIYGATHDPDKGAEFRNTGDALHLRVPPEPRLLAAGKFVNAPRVWREVRGNFTVSVRVSFPIRPTVPDQHPDAHAARAGGGLVVWLDDHHFLTLTRDELADDGKPGERYRSERYREGSVQGSADYGAIRQSVYLRIVRWEQKLSCSYSSNGKKWQPIGWYPIEWGDLLQVGVVAENGFKAPFEVTFDEYSLVRTNP